MADNKKATRFDAVVVTLGTLLGASLVLMRWGDSMPLWMAVGLGLAGGAVWSLLVVWGLRLAIRRTREASS